MICGTVTNGDLNVKLSTGLHGDDAYRQTTFDGFFFLTAAVYLPATLIFGQYLIISRLLSKAYLE